MSVTAERPIARSDPSGSWRAWPLRDRLLLGLCWVAGLALIAIAVSIVLYMAIKGIQYLRPGLLFSRPSRRSTSRSPAASSTRSPGRC